MDDWTRGNDPEPYYRGPKAHLWQNVTMLAARCIYSMPSLMTIRIAIKDRNHPIPTASSPALQTALFPADDYLLSWPRECASYFDPQNSMNKGFRLSQCEQAYRYVSTPSEQQVAIAKLGCYVYGRGVVDEGVLWTIEEVNELWPCTRLQAELWTWTEQSDMKFLGGA